MYFQTFLPAYENLLSTPKTARFIDSAKKAGCELLFSVLFQIPEKRIMGLLKSDIHQRGLDGDSPWGLSPVQIEAVYPTRNYSGQQIVRFKPSMLVGLTGETFRDARLNQTGKIKALELNRRQSGFKVVIYDLMAFVRHFSSEFIPEELSSALVKSFKVMGPVRFLEVNHEFAGSPEFAKYVHDYYCARQIQEGLIHFFSK